MHRVIVHRQLIALVAALATGVCGLQYWPVTAADPVLALIASQRPTLLRAGVYGYSALWFTTPLLVANLALSLLYIFGTQRWAMREPGTLPPYPPISARRELYVVLGEQHHRLKPGRAMMRCRLMIPGIARVPCATTVAMTLSSPVAYPADAWRGDALYSLKPAHQVMRDSVSEAV